MHYIPAPYGILKDTFQVYPGECVTIESSGELSKYLYWEFPKIDKNKLIQTKRKH